MGQPDRHRHLVDHLEARLDAVGGMTLPVFPAADEQAARLVAERLAQRILGHGGDTWPGGGHEVEVARPPGVLGHGLEQHAVLVQFHVVQRARRAGVERGAVGRDELVQQPVQDRRGEVLVAQLHERDGDGRLVTHPLAVVLPDAAVEAPALRDHRRQLAGGAAEQVVEQRLAEAGRRVVGPPRGVRPIERPRVGQAQLDRSGGGIEIVGEPHRGAAAAGDVDGGADGRVEAGGLEGDRPRSVTGVDHLDGPHHAARRGRAGEPFDHVQVAGQPAGFHGGDAGRLVPSDLQGAGIRHRGARRRDDADACRFQSVRGVHRERVALRAEAVGVHDQEPERGAVAGRRVLHGGLDDAVAEEEVGGVGQPRPHIGMPVGRVIVIHVLGNVDHVTTSEGGGLRPRR